MACRRSGQDGAHGARARRARRRAGTACLRALSDVGNLPRYVPQLTSAEPREGDVVEVEARYEGRTQHGEASFEHDDATRTIRWSSASGYAGSMRVDDDGDGARLTLHLHTTHDEDSDRDVAATLDAIRRLVEAEL